MLFRLLARGSGLVMVMLLRLARLSVLVMLCLLPPDRADPPPDC